MLQNAYLLAKIGADTAENERKFAGSYKNFAEIISIQDIFRQFSTELDQTYLPDNCRKSGYFVDFAKMSGAENQKETAVLQEMIKTWMEKA